MKKQNTRIDEMLSNIGKTRIGKKESKKKLTLESMIYDESEGAEDFDFTETDDEEIEANDTPQMSTSGIIRDIRVQVLKGLAALAENPESEEYDTLKRILTICDKPTEKKPSLQGKNQ